MKDKRNTELLNLAIDVSIEAGKLAMNYFQKENKNVRLKWDFSPVTIADKEASSLILNRLSGTKINIISEEEKVPKYSVREHWDECWIIDPIDGTKEYINGNNDFTVNIAFVSKNKVLMGIIYVPVTSELYYGIKGKGSYKQYINDSGFKNDEIYSEKFKISPLKESEKLVIVTSRSHLDRKTKQFINNLQKKITHIDFMQRGSSLKFCMVAEGKANVFPRFARIHEWDTAAGQAIAEASGCYVSELDGEPEIMYNKKKLITPMHIVASSKEIVNKIL